MTLSPPVLYYHTVAPRQAHSWALRELTYELDYFENQISTLAKRGYRTLLLSEWMDFRNGSRPTTGKEICITFDDGYLDNWVYVLPLARKYGMCFTLFVSPDCVDPRPVVRPTLEDVWAGRRTMNDLEDLGYLSWSEISLMQQSGVVDIQSHTMSHAKYVASGELSSFYYGGPSGLYTLWQMFPEEIPTYPANPEFGNRLPLGMPLFREQSAVAVRKHVVNRSMIDEVLAAAEGRDLRDESQRGAFEKEALSIYEQYRARGELVESVESDEEYRDRLEYEIVGSKRTIERQLNKDVEFLCWPHGDNTREAHQLALEAGYKATTVGKMTSESERVDRIPRFGTQWYMAGWLNRLKLQYKISSHLGRQPYYSLWRLNELKNRLSNSS